MGIHVLYGKEPYLIDYNKAKYVDMISVPEINLGYFEEWSDNVIRFLMTYPILDQVRVAIVTCKSFKSLGDGDSFEKYLKSPSPMGELVIIIKDVDKRCSLYKRLNKMPNVLVECDKLVDARKLQHFLVSEIKKRGGEMSQNAYTLFLRRENYIDRDDINLYNLLSDIDRLIAYDRIITEDTVRLLVKENLTENIFGIAKMIQNKDTVSLRNQAFMLSGNAIGTLSALLREYRIAWKNKFFDSQLIGTKYIALSSLEESVLREGMNIIISSIDGIKNGSLPEKNALFFTFMKLVSLHRN